MTWDDGGCELKIVTAEEVPFYLAIGWELWWPDFKTDDGRYRITQKQLTD